MICIEWFDLVDQSNFPQFTDFFTPNCICFHMLKFSMVWLKFTYKEICIIDVVNIERFWLYSLCLINIEYICRLGHKKKKETLFYGLTDLPIRVGRSGDFFFFNFFFFYLWFQKVTPTTQKFRENFDIFCRKILGKYLDLFSSNFSQNFQILVKKWLILPDFGKK